MHHVSSSEPALLFTLCAVSENMKTSPPWVLAHCMYTVCIFILRLHHRSSGRPRASLKCVKMWLTSNRSFLFVCLFVCFQLWTECTKSALSHTRSIPEWTPRLDSWFVKGRNLETLETSLCLYLHIIVFQSSSETTSARLSVILSNSTWF